MYDINAKIGGECKISEICSIFFQIGKIWRHVSTRDFSLRYQMIIFSEAGFCNDPEIIKPSGNPSPEGIEIFLFIFQTHVKNHYNLRASVF